MKVQNCLGKDFTYACSELALKVSYVYQADLIIGIHSGGAIVAQHVFLTELFKNTHLIDIATQRPSTQYKKKFRVDIVLSFLPLWICNLLRVVETQYAIKRFNSKSPVNRDVIVKDVDYAKIRKAERILIIDDAVDSGSTLLAVCKYIHHLNPLAEVKTAALTVTFPQPIQRPDFALHEGVLLRFPWAADAKGRNSCG